MTTDHPVNHGDLPDVPEAAPAGGGTATVTEDDVTEAMKDVVDPELGINVVDLGLVYGVQVDEGLERGARLVLDDVGERAGGRRQRHVERDRVVVVHLLAVEQAEVDDVDAELGVDDVLHRLDDVVVGRLDARGVGCRRRLQDRLGRRRGHGRRGGRRLGAGLGHAAPPGVVRSVVSSRACAVASFHAIHPSSAHFTRAG